MSETRDNKNTTRKFISNIIVMDTIVRYEKPKTKYNAGHHAIPNPTRSDLWIVYSIIASAANYATGIASISYETIMEKADIANRNKIKVCIDILEQLGLIYYLKGGLFGGVDTYANSFIFPREDFREKYPNDPALYDQYILDPIAFSGEKKSAAPKKTSHSRKKPSDYTSIFDKEGCVRDHEYLADLMSKHSYSELLSNKVVSSNDQKWIKQIYASWGTREEYKQRHFNGNLSYKLNKEEVDWLDASYSG